MEGLSGRDEMVHEVSNRVKLKAFLKVKILLGDVPLIVLVVAVNEVEEENPLPGGQNRLVVMEIQSSQLKRFLVLPTSKKEKIWCNGDSHWFVSDPRNGNKEFSERRATGNEWKQFQCLTSLLRAWRLRNIWHDAHEMAPKPESTADAEQSWHCVGFRMIFRISDMFIDDLDGDENYRFKIVILHQYRIDAMVRLTIKQSKQGMKWLIVKNGRKWSLSFCWKEKISSWKKPAERSLSKPRHVRNKTCWRHFGCQRSRMPAWFSTSKSGFDINLVKKELQLAEKCLSNYLIIWLMDRSNRPEYSVRFKRPGIVQVLVGFQQRIQNVHKARSFTECRRLLREHRNSNVFLIVTKNSLLNKRAVHHLRSYLNVKFMFCFGSERPWKKYLGDREKRISRHSLTESELTILTIEYAMSKDWELRCRYATVDCSTITVRINCAP